MSETPTPKYTVEWHIKESDKYGEYSWLRIKFSHNGKTFLRSSEKYKNIAFSRRVAKQFAVDLSATYLEFDTRKK